MLSAVRVKGSIASIIAPEGKQLTFLLINDSIILPFEAPFFCKTFYFQGNKKGDILWRIFPD